MPNTQCKKYVTVEVGTFNSTRAYRLYYGNRKRNMLSNGMDGIWAMRAPQRRLDVPFDSLEKDSESVVSLIGTKGLKFLRVLSKSQDFSEITDVHFVSAWQVNVFCPISWDDDRLDKAILPVIRRMTGKIPRRRAWPT